VLIAGYVFASVRYAAKFRSTLPIAGSAASALRTRSRITRCSRVLATNVSAIMISSVTFSSALSGHALRPASSAVRALRWGREPHRSRRKQRPIDPRCGVEQEYRSKQAGRAVNEYLATLDDAAYGAATQVVPKFISPSDPAAQWTGAMKSAAFFAYADNYLIDVKFGIIMDVEASRAVRQAEVGASRTMIERTEACFGIRPEWLACDTAYGSAANLNWLVNEQVIAPTFR
jgi:hypothetical protein